MDDVITATSVRPASGSIERMAVDMGPNSVMKPQRPLALLSLSALALAFVSCARTPSAVSKAVARSNEEAKRLYQVEPFTKDHGQLLEEGDHTVWEALTSFAGKDMVARVTFDESGSVIGVEVQMLVQPTLEPSTNFDPLPPPSVPYDARPRIPEVMQE